jgi:aspartate racemase
MPKLIPSGGSVSWPVHEGTLGVVGVAPWATLEFVRNFYELIAAEKDWHYPRVLLDINCKLPSRGRHLQLGEQDPSPYIAATISELALAGATVAIVACNTAHILFSRWATGSPIPIIHIIDAAIEEARLAKPCKLLALVSSSLATSGAYEDKAKASNLAYQTLPLELQKLVNEMIEDVKTMAAIMPESDRRLRELINFFIESGVDTVILGCTELSLLAPCIESAGLCVVDSNKALAKAAYVAIMQ